MKLYKIVVISLLTMVGSTYAIKQSSKQMLLDCFPPSSSPYANNGVLFIRKFGSVKLAIEQLALSASADKYADLILRLADQVIQDSMHLDGYSALASAMCQAVEKLNKVEKISKNKLEKARILKKKIAQEIERQHVYELERQKQQAERIQNMPTNNLPDVARFVMRHEDAIRLQKNNKLSLKMPVKKLFWK